MAHFYYGVLEDASLLRSQGHVAPHRYPLAMLWSEARTARRRVVNAIETEAVVMQATIASVFAKKGSNPLKTALKKLRDSSEG